MHVILNTLAPVFLVVLLGAVLRHVGFLTESFSTALNKFVFWVPLPVFLFTSIQGSKFVAGSLPAAGVMIGTTLIIAAIAWFGAPFFGISRWSRGTFCQSVFRSNNAYVGLPVILFAYTGASLERITSVKALAALSLAPCLILYNVLAVLVLTPNALGIVQKDKGASPSRQTGGTADAPLSSGRLLKKVLLGIVKNPLIVSCVAGAIGLWARQSTGVELPEFLARTLRSVGSLAGPGALVALGASLTPARMRMALRGAHVVAILKLVVCPLVGATLARAAGLDSDARFVAVAYLTCPTAVASFVMAQAMRGDDVLAGGAVALTTLYSVLALAATLALFGPVL